jgi:outer membrane receptor protein involved in Fe transport
MFALLAVPVAAAQQPSDAVADEAATAEQTGEAQPNPPAAEPSPPAPTLGEGTIVVTGSRVSRAGFAAPTPTTALSAEEIARQAPSNIGEVLNELPSFRPDSTPNTSGNASLGGGQIIANLRGLGAQRTLVLVNGRRFVSSNINGTVDLAQVPTLLIQRIDVVTGGASAAWGSDAVSGVVNAILKTNLHGIEATALGGIAEVGDNREAHLAFAYGGSSPAGNVRYMVGADYIWNSGMLTQFTRDWGRKSVGLITNTAFATNGLPNYIISPDVHVSNMTAGGLIVGGPLAGTAFGPGGVPYDFQFGQVFGSSMIGGESVFPNPTLAAMFGKPYSSLTSLGRVEVDVTPNVRAFAEVTAARSTAGGISQEPRDSGLVIQADNAFLPQSVRDQMAALDLDTITVARFSLDTGRVKTNSTTKTVQGVAGLEGDFGGSWSWDASYLRGYSQYNLNFGPNNRIQQNFRRAIDAVLNPADNSIVCRSTLADPTNGCIPIDIFGPGSAHINDYAFGTAHYELVNELEDASANLRGEPFSTWAGPVSIATGLEYRRVSGHANTDAIQQQLQPSGTTGGWIFGNQKPFRGSYNVWEGYGETVVPLAKEAPFAWNLEANGAVRYTHYSTSGGVTTWKLGGNYEPLRGLKFRATRSRDIRAPSLSELFIGGTGSVFPIVFDPVLNRTVQVQQVNSGNLSLRPEIANSWTAGVVIEPRALPRFGMSVDYFNINIKDAITTIGAAAIAQGCSAGNAAYCDLISFNSNGTISFIRSQPLNLNAQKTSGVDVEASYRFPLGNAGRLSLRALVTYVDKYITVFPEGPRELVNQLSAFNGLSGIPRWSGTGNLTYDLNRFSFNLRSKFIGSGVFNRDFRTGAGAANTINRNKIPAYAYLDLSAEYNAEMKGGQKVSFFGVVNNLLDTDPPLIPSGTGGGTSGSSTNSVFYDVIGRAFRVGIRFKG